MKPVLQALVLADRIYTDVSGKKIICGTFNAYVIGRVKGEPQPETGKILLPGGTDPGCPSAYISLTDVVDETVLSLQFVSLTKNQVMFQTSLKISQANRLNTVEIVVPLPPASLLTKEPGAYSFDLVWSGEILGSHRFRVEQMTDHENTGD